MPLGDQQPPSETQSSASTKSSSATLALLYQGRSRTDSNQRHTTLHPDRAGTRRGSLLRRRVSLPVDREIEQEHIDSLCGRNPGGAGNVTSPIHLTPTGTSIALRSLTTREPDLALIERDSKVLPASWNLPHPKRMGNDLMRQVARKAFATDASLDAVQVHEHAGSCRFLEMAPSSGARNNEAQPDDKATSSSTASTVDNGRDPSS